jgi:hypothetical protein
MPKLRGAGLSSSPLPSPSPLSLDLLLAASSAGPAAGPTPPLAACGAGTAPRAHSSPAPAAPPPAPAPVPAVPDSNASPAAAAFPNAAPNTAASGAASTGRGFATSRPTVVSSACRGHGSFSGQGGVVSQAHADRNIKEWRVEGGGGPGARTGGAQTGSRRWLPGRQAVSGAALPRGGGLARFIVTAAANDSEG